MIYEIALFPVHKERIDAFRQTFAGSRIMLMNDTPLIDNSNVRCGS